MKKLITLFLCFALLLTAALGLAACTETPDEPAKDSATEAPATIPDTDDGATEAPTDDATEAPTDDATEPEETEPETFDYSDSDVYVTISTAEELMAFATTVNAAAADLDSEVDWYDKTIVILEDIDMTGYEWTPLDSTLLDGVTFDGKGHTISNLTFKTHEPPAGTLADSIGCGFVGVNRSNLNFRDLTLSCVRITAWERAVGAFIGLNNTSGFVSFENCHVEDFVVDGWCDYNNQDRDNDGHPISFRIGGFVGHNMVGWLDFTDCTAKDLEFSGFHNLAGFLGYDNGNTDAYCFENCHVEDARFTFSYCLSDSYTVDMPRKFVSVFFNDAHKWADNIDEVVENGNSYKNVTYYDWTDNNKAYLADEFRSWTREEADAAG